MPRPSASPALRVLRTLRTGSRMTLRRHKDFLALAGALQKIAGYRGLLAVRASPFPWLAAYDAFVFNTMLRKSIVFSHHNLVTDHAFSEMHMIICRNVMIYFNQSLQNSVVGLFIKSLLRQGFLCLGNKESLFRNQHESLFSVINDAEKIFRLHPKHQKRKGK